MITVHHLLVSQSERVIWLMEELGLQYELKSYPRDPNTMLAHPIFAQLHPIGQAPVIQDGDVTMAESLAIFTYILDLYGEGKLRIAPGQPGYADFVYWYHYSNGGLMPAAMAPMMMMFTGVTEGPGLDGMKARFARHLGMVNDRLGNNEWLAGSQFTAADILCHFPFGTMSSFMQVDYSAYPNIRKWLDRLGARPGYQKAMKLAGHTNDPSNPAKAL